MPRREIDPDEIVRESGGNPFFLSELVRYAQAGIDPREAGLDPGDGSARATNLEAVIRSRMRRLPDAARTLLEILAVCGAPLRPRSRSGRRARRKR